MEWGVHPLSMRFSSGLGGSEYHIPIDRVGFPSYGVVDVRLLMLCAD